MEAEARSRAGARTPPRSRAERDMITPWGLRLQFDQGPALGQLRLVELQLVADQRDDDLVLGVERHLHGDFGEDLRRILVELVAPDMVGRLGLRLVEDLELRVPAERAVV